MGQKLTTEEFITKCKVKHGDRYKYTKTIYTGNKTKVLITCRVHGDFEQVSGKHMNRGDNCPKCAYVTRKRAVAKGRIDFITAANKVHDNKYNYSKVNYTNNKSKVIITCPVHGDFTMAPGNHINQSQGCPTCGIIQTGVSNSGTTEEFITKARKIHGDKYSYIESYYVNNSTHVKIICKEHGVFTQAPNNHVNQKQGCPSCNTAHGGFKPNKPAILYYLSVNNGQAYKIGITNKTVNLRFSVQELENIKAIKTWYYEIGQEAYNREQEILKTFKDFKYTGNPLLVIGNSELFNTDVLLLDILTA